LPRSYERVLVRGTEAGPSAAIMARTVARRRRSEGISAMARSWILFRRRSRSATRPR